MLRPLACIPEGLLPALTPAPFLPPKKLVPTLASRRLVRVEQPGLAGHGCVRLRSIPGLSARQRGGLPGPRSRVKHRAARPLVLRARVHAPVRAIERLERVLQRVADAVKEVATHSMTLSVKSARDGSRSLG